MIAGAFSATLTFQVEPLTRECFYEDMLNTQVFKMNWRVTRGGLLDIVLKINSPTGRVLYDKLAYFNHKDDRVNEDEGTVVLSAQGKGVHEICFDNTMSRWTAKVVQFTVDDNEPEEHEKIAKLEHLGKTVDSVIQIADDLENLEKLQKNLRVREQSHRDATEDTNSRIVWISILESVVLITLTAFQIYLIQSWFSSNAKQGGRV